MGDVKLQIYPVRRGDLLARFQLEISLPNGLQLKCNNGQILRGRTMHDRLYVLYPKGQNGNGKPISTWLFDNESQRIFDDWVVESYRKLERRIEQQQTSCSTD